MVLEDCDIIIKRRKSKTTEQLSVPKYPEKRIQNCQRENEFLISNNETKRTKYLPNHETSNTTKMYSNISLDCDTENLANTTKNNQSLEHKHYATNRLKSNNNINVCTQNSATWAETLAGYAQRDKGIAEQRDCNADKFVSLHKKDFITRPTEGSQLDIACKTETDCGAFGDHVPKNELLIKDTAAKDLKEIQDLVINSSLRGENQQTVNCCHICCNPYRGCLQPECFCNCPQHLVDPKQNDCSHYPRCFKCLSHCQERTQLLNSYRRKCTDLQTNYFYNRTSESRSPSPEILKHEKYLKIQQNEKTKMKEKLLREEQMPGRRKEHEEKSHKDKRVNKESNNKKADNRQKSTKTKETTTTDIDITTRLEKRIIETLGHETVSKLVHILDRFANEEEKLLNKAMEETFEDAKQKTEVSFDVMRREGEERIRRTSSRPSQPSRDNSHKFAQTCTVDPLEATQYSKDTLKMMKKMRIKEYKAIKPKVKEKIATHTPKEVSNEKINTHLIKARLQKYNEYIMKYKSQSTQKEDKSDQQESIASDRTFTKDVGDSFEEHIYKCVLAPNRGWDDDCSRSENSDFKVIFKRNNTFIYKSSTMQREGTPKALGDGSKSIEKSGEPISYINDRGRSSKENSLREDIMTNSNNQYANRSKKPLKAKEKSDVNNKKGSCREFRKQREILADDEKSKQDNYADAKKNTRRGFKEQREFAAEYSQIERDLLDINTNFKDGNLLHPQTYERKENVLLYTNQNNEDGRPIYQKTKGLRSSEYNQEHVADCNYSTQNQRYNTEQVGYPIQHTIECSSRSSSIAESRIDTQKNNRDLTEDIEAGLSYTNPLSSEKMQCSNKNNKTLKRDSLSSNRDQLIDLEKVNKNAEKQGLHYYGSVRGHDSLDEQISYKLLREKGQKVTEDQNRCKKSTEKEKAQDETDVKSSSRIVTSRKLFKKEQSAESEICNNHTKGIEGEYHNMDKADNNTKNQPKVSDPVYPNDSLSIESKTQESHHQAYATPSVLMDNLTIWQSNTIDTLKCLRDFLNSYQKGLLEDNSLHELAGDLMTKLGSCKCSYNEASVRLSQDKSTITLPEKLTIETQYSEQDEIESLTSTKLTVKTEQNELKDFSGGTTQETFAETKEITTNIEKEICHLSYLQESLISAENCSDIDNQAIQKNISPEQNELAQITAVSSNKEVQIEPMYHDTPQTFHSHTKSSHQPIKDSNLFEKQKAQCISLEDRAAETPLKSLSKTKIEAVKDEDITNIDNFNITGQEHQEFPCMKTTSNPHRCQDLNGTVSSGTLCEHYKLEEEDPCHEVGSYNETYFPFTTETQYDSFVIEHCEKSIPNDLPGVCKDKAHDCSLHNLCAESRNYVAEFVNVPNVSEASNSEFQKPSQCLMSEDEANPLSFPTNMYMKRGEPLDKLLQQSSKSKTKYDDKSKPSMKTEMNCHKESNHYDPDNIPHRILKQTACSQKKNLPSSTCINDLPELPQCSCMMGAFVDMLDIYYQNAGKQLSNRLLNC